MPAVITRGIEIGLTRIGVPALFARVAADVIYNVGVAYATNAIADSLAPKAPGASDGQQSIVQPLPYRRRGYGRMKVGRAMIFHG